MTEGVYIEPIGCYLHIDSSGDKVLSIFFSTKTPSQHSELAKNIADYLCGNRPCPSVDLDFNDFTRFQRSVYAIVREIPRGKTRTYADVSQLANRPNAARAVGQALAANRFAILVPCHRVIAKEGLGGFSWGLKLKKKLLALEKEPF